MRTELGLSGNKLIIYAIIHSFSQDGKSFFSGSLSYIAEWAGIHRQAVSTIISELIKAGLVVRQPLKKSLSPGGYLYYSSRSRGIEPTAASKVSDSIEVEMTVRKKECPENGHSSTYSLTGAMSGKRTVTVRNSDTILKDNIDILNSPTPEEEKKDKKTNKKTNMETEGRSSRIRSVLRELYPDAVYPDTLPPSLLSGTDGLTDGELEEYFRFVAERSAKADSPAGYFYHLITQSGQGLMEAFREKHHQAENDERPQKDAVTCPVCGTLHNRYYSCPSCGLNPDADGKTVERTAYIWHLPEEKKAQLEKEVLHLQVQGFNMFQRKQELDRIYARYGVPSS